MLRHLLVGAASSLIVVIFRASVLNSFLHGTLSVMGVGLGRSLRA